MGQSLGTAYIVVGPSHIAYYTLNLRKSFAVKAFLKYHTANDDWDAAKKKGWRVVEVELREIP